MCRRIEQRCLAVMTELLAERCRRAVGRREFGHAQKDVLVVVQRWILVVQRARVILLKGSTFDTKYGTGTSVVGRHVTHMIPL